MFSAMIRPATVNVNSPISLMAAVAVTVAAALSSMVLAAPQDATTQTEKAVMQELTPSPSEAAGVLANTSRAFPGYTLITPSVNTTYLFDNQGRAVNSWPSEVSTGVAYLLDNGHLFRTAAAANLAERFRGPAKSGRFQEFDWDGNVVWDFE